MSSGPMRRQKSRTAADRMLAARRSQVGEGRLQLVKVVRLQPCCLWLHLPGSTITVIEGRKPSWARVESGGVESRSLGESSWALGVVVRETQQAPGRRDWAAEYT